MRKYRYAFTAAVSLTLDVQIGIDYVGQPHELRGCINDAENVRRFLIGVLCFL